MCFRPVLNINTVKTTILSQDLCFKLQKHFKSYLFLFEHYVQVTLDKTLYQVTKQKCNVNT